MKPIGFMTIFGLLVLSLPSGASGSDEMSVRIGFWALHVNRSEGTNEHIYLVAFSYGDYIGCRFINSWNDETYFAGKRFHTRRFSHSKNDDLYVQGNLYTGLMHGYKDHLPNIGGFTVGLLPTLGAGYQRVSVEVGYVPTPKGGVFMSLLRFML